MSSHFVITSLVTILTAAVVLGIPAMPADYHPPSIALVSKDAPRGKDRVWPSRDTLYFSIAIGIASFTGL